MKKLTAFLLSILLLLSLTACGGTQNTRTSSESGGKVFVVYFSASGNTERRRYRRHALRPHTHRALHNRGSELVGRGQPCQPGQCFPYGADAQEIRTWVASLGL